MEHTKDEINKAIDVLEAFIKDKVILIEKARTILNYSNNGKPLILNDEKQSEESLEKISLRASKALKTVGIKNTTDLMNYCTMYDIKQLLMFDRITPQIFQQISDYIEAIDHNKIDHNKNDAKPKTLFGEKKSEDSKTCEEFLCYSMNSVKVKISARAKNAIRALDIGSVQDFLLFVKSNGFEEIKAIHNVGIQTVNELERFYDENSYLLSETRFPNLNDDKYI